MSTPGNGSPEHLLFDLEVALRMAGELVEDLEGDDLADVARRFPADFPDGGAEAAACASGPTAAGEGADPSDRSAARNGNGPPAGDGVDPGTLAPEYLLPAIVAYTYREIYSALGNLREGRDELGQIARDRIPDTHRKLQEIESTTELAATDMLDGLDRALTLVDRIDSDRDPEGSRVGPDGERPEPSETGAASGTGDELGRGDDDAAREALRDQLHDLISALQFQDITAQQLEFAGHILTDMERRLSRIAANFAACFPEGALEAVEDEASRGDSDRHDPRDDAGDPGTVAAPASSSGRGGEGPGDPGTFDPDATTQNAGERQAVADEIFTRPASGEARTS